MSGNFFKAVVQQVLLFGAELWVVCPRMERALSVFIHGATRRLTGQQLWKGRYGKWFYPSLEVATKEAGLTDAQTSIKEGRTGSHSILLRNRFWTFARGRRKERERG